MIRRLLRTVWLDVRLQFRYGFYCAGAFVGVLMVLLLLQLPPDARTYSLPLVVLASLTITGFYFIAGLVLLEKGEGVLEALIVTPLRTDEYLFSKLITLSLLALLENVLVVTVAAGLGGYNLLPLLAGGVIMATMMALVGFVMVARFDSINTFIFPSALVTMVLSLPLFDYLGIWETPLLALIPTGAPLALLEAAFGPVAVGRVVYGVLYGLLWVGVAYWWGRRTFYTFIIRKAGVR